MSKTSLIKWLSPVTVFVTCSLLSACGDSGPGPDIHDTKYRAVDASGQTLDISESLSLIEVLGETAYNIPVTSIKGVTGNPLAAGGAHQVIAGTLSIENQTVPPTANLCTQDPECGLDYVPEGPRMVALNKILINSHGSGAMNSSLIIGSVDSI